MRGPEHTSRGTPTRRCTPMWIPGTVGVPHRTRPVSPTSANTRVSTHTPHPSSDVHRCPHRVFVRRGSPHRSVVDSGGSQKEGPSGATRRDSGSGDVRDVTPQRKGSPRPRRTGVPKDAETVSTPTPSSRGERTVRPTRHSLDPLSPGVSPGAVGLWYRSGGLWGTEWTLSQTSGRTGHGRNFLPV